MPNPAVIHWGNGVRKVHTGKAWVVCTGGWFNTGVFQGVVKKRSELRRDSTPRA